MTGIVVSHRVEDEPYGAAQLIETLTQHFGPEEVGYAPAELPPTEQMAQMLRYDVRSARLVLAVIGPRWLNARDPGTGRRRITEPTDWVRVQLAEAFRCGVQVIPVLLREAALPPARDLPDDISVLVWRTALPANPARPGEMAELVRAVTAVLDQPSVPRSRLWPSRPIRDPYQRARAVRARDAQSDEDGPSWGRRALVAAAVLAVLAAVGVSVAGRDADDAPTPVPARTGTGPSGSASGGDPSPPSPSPHRTP